MTEKTLFDGRSFIATVPEAARNPVSEALLDNPLVQLHLVDPSTPAMELSQRTNVPLENVVQAYQMIRQSEAVRSIIDSPYYPRRLMTLEARNTIADWVEDPEYAGKVLHGEPVLPRTLELHATEGVCNQGCAMCLWSNKRDKTYAKLGLKEEGLMTNAQWIQTIAEAKEGGTKRIVFSGGGEPLLRHDLFDVIAAANDMGLTTQLYSNGFSMDKLPESAKREMLIMGQVRFSVHSPDADTYSNIVRMPSGLNALERVEANISELLERREREGGKVKIGIGFVTQPINFEQIEAMAYFAANIGVDFLNIRQDEVSVTQGLTPEQREYVAKQLRSIREHAIRGDYGETQVDMADDLTALANGIQLPERRVATCHMKRVRPAISPYGIMGACDLMVEPNFANSHNTFGNVRQSIPLVVEQASGQHVKANCKECMPSGRTGNAMYTKFQEDAQAGIHFTEQPFNV